MVLGLLASSGLVMKLVKVPVNHVGISVHDMNHAVRNWSALDLLMSHQLEDSLLQASPDGIACGVSALPL